jgi:Holliday junction resolvase RusA-like endonuclease
MNIVNIKPLSVNEAWQGKRYKTNKYNDYIDKMMLILPKIEVENTKLFLYVEFGFSSKASDIDNALKTFIDCLVKKYKVDDRNIYRLIVEKVIVKKGNEYIKFNFEKL